MDDNYLIIKNPDKEHVAKVVKKIKENGGYCISKFERNPDTKCNCKVFKETGVCKCGLFLKFACVDVTEVG